MQNNQETAFKEALFEHCHVARSGSFFIATADNRSAQVVLHKGQLLGVNYAEYQADQALEILLTRTDIRYAFQDELIYPLRETLLPDMALALLNRHGYSTYCQSLSVTDQDVSIEREAEGYTASAEAPERVMMYRGQKVVKDKKRSPTPSVRIYRGQPIITD